MDISYQFEKIMNNPDPKPDPERKNRNEIVQITENIKTLQTNGKK